MAKVNYGWLKTYNDEYFAPKTILSQLHTDEGTLLEDFLDNSYLKLSEGGELEGPLLLARDPEVDKEAATKKYVDEKVVSTIVYSQEVAEDETSEIVFSDVDDMYSYLVYYNGILLTLGKNYIITGTNTISLLDWTANAGDLITISGKQFADNNQNSIFMASTLLGLTASVEELNYTDGVTSSIQTQLNNKAPLASPALTGTPTAPTAAAGTNTTQVATTAFVQAAINNAIIAAMEAVY